MLRLKTPAQITTLAEGGKILAAILEEVATMVKPDVISRDLDTKARKLMRQYEVTPSFFNYAPGGHKPFPAALCVSINEGIVHGLPNDQVIAPGDVVKLDGGIVYQGLYLDSARTVGVEPLSDEAKKLLAVTKESLARAVAAARVGNTIGDIGAAVQAYVESHGFGVVRQLVGHGVGFAVHEEPSVPNFGKAGSGIKLQEGLVIAIEPMVTIGDPTVTTGDDGWTVVTKSGKLSAHEEHTIAVTKNGPQILTQR